MKKIVFREIEKVDNWYQEIQKVAKWTLFMMNPEEVYGKTNYYELYIDGVKSPDVFPERNITEEEAKTILEAMDIKGGIILVKMYKRYPTPGVFITHPKWELFYRGTYRVEEEGQ